MKKPKYQSTETKKNRIDQIREEIRQEEKDLLEIKDLVTRMKQKVVDKEPSHFSSKDILKIFFGSLTVGFAFIFSSALVKTALALDVKHLEFIILTTLILLSIQIYLVWHTRVKDKKTRPLGEFLTKRLTTLYLVAIISSFILIYIFNIDSQFSTFFDVMRLVVLMSMPCSLGAAIPSILKEY